MGRPRKRAVGTEGEADPALDPVPVETGQDDSENTVTEPWDGHEDIFWETERGENYRVLIRRTNPHAWPHPVHGTMVNVRGPLGELPPHATAAWVYTNHGGGDFIISAFTDARISMTRRLYIPGAPLVRDPNTPAGAGERSGISATPAPVAGVTVEDLPVTGDLTRDVAMLKNVMMFKAALRESNTENELTGVLLRAVLDQKVQASPMGQLEDTLRLFNQVKEMMPAETTGGDGQPWWLPLAGKFLEALPNLPKGQPNVPPLKPLLPAPAVATAQPTQLPPQPTMEETEPMPQPLDWQAVLTEAMGHILSHFQSEPPTPENRVADLLDLVAAMPVDKRVQMIPLKQRLQDYGHSALAEPYQDDPAKLAAWPGYFGTVFDLWTDPNRKVEGFPTP